MNKVPYLLKRDVFSNEELQLIYDELQFLKQLMKQPEETASATGLDGNYIKNNNGVFLESVYSKGSNSSIFKIVTKNIPQFIEEYSNIEITNRSALSCNSSWTLVSHYEHNGYYAPHTDATVATILFWFNKEPRTFSGGDLIFNDTDEVIEYQNNTMIIFPGWAMHSVPKLKGEGRYCVTVGLNIVPQ